MPRRLHTDHLLVALSLGAGCVDAAGFMTDNVFPANMTGNSVVLALALANVKVEGAWLAGLVLVAFCLGAAAGCRLLRSAPDGWSLKVHHALLLTGGVLLAGAIALVLGMPDNLSPVLTAFAMGVQAAAVQQVGVAGVSTIVVTNTLLTAIRRWVGVPAAKKVPPHRSIPAWSWAAYFTGALLGGLLQRFAPPPCPMAVAAIILIAVVVAAAKLPLASARSD